MIIITKVNVENLSLFMGQYTALIMGNIQHVSSSGHLYWTKEIKYSVLFFGSGSRPFVRSPSCFNPFGNCAVSCN